MARTKTNIRNMKSKGSTFERDVRYSLSCMFDGLILTKEQGFQMQYDIVSEIDAIAIECKKHKSMSWNEAKRLFKKLENVAPGGYERYLIFQTHRQPVLVMSRESSMRDGVVVREFEDEFGVPFDKAPTVKREKKRGDSKW